MNVKNLTRKIYLTVSNMYRLPLFLFLIFIVPKMSITQDKFVSGESKFITKFPFRQLTGGVVVLKATFNSISDTFNFILDTGSGAISLDSATAAYYSIENKPSGVSVSGIAGTKKVNFTKDNSIHFPGLSVEHLDFFINDYSLLSSVYGIRVDGIIGYSFLSRYIVSLDYDKKTISIFTPGRFKYAPKSYFLKPIFTNLPIQPLTIKDQREINGNFYFDTGAGLNFLLTQRFLTDSGFLKKKRRPVSILVQGIGGKRELGLTVIKKVKIGPYVFKNVPTNIFDDELNALSYPFLGGLIGNDILRRFNVVINYPDRIIAIKPNTHFRNLFDYSYTGMNLYLDEFGQILIDDIVSGSPAEKYGLENGDIIVSVDKDFSNDLDEYRNHIREAGKKITFVVVRDGDLKVINMRVGRVF